MRTAPLCGFLLAAKYQKSENHDEHSAGSHSNDCAEIHSMLLSKDVGMRMHSASGGFLGPAQYQGAENHQEQHSSSYAYNHGCGHSLFLLSARSTSAQDLVDNPGAGDRNACRPECV
jgi:hypothetical protein